jgi:glycerophosphoryl diester phosphodiesterase
MHDYKLDRTTNGSGDVADYTYAELMKLRLKDPHGTLTSFTVPTLDQVLKWARNKTVLTVDIKKTISPQVIEKIIRQNNAEAYAAVITYDLETARTYYALNSKLMISVTVRNKDEYERLAATGIPLKNVIAFTGITEPDPALYELLHAQGVFCILGTMGNLDKSHAARQTNVYARLVSHGADILATDYPVEAAEAIRESIPDKSSKKKFYIKAGEMKKQPETQNPATRSRPEKKATPVH